MIPEFAEAAIDHERRQADWKQSLATTVRDPARLLQHLGFSSDPGLIDAARRAARHFPLRVPMGYIARMQPGDIHDPLLRQVLPLAEELANAPGYRSDPVGDMPAMVKPGLLHKYHGRVLLVTTGACAIHCRYCFRREFPYTQADPKRDDWQSALQYVAADRSINEIILSGGDPLTLTDHSLAKLLGQCGQIPHLQRLRIHSRIPVVLPERVNDSLCDVLSQSSLQIIHVIHSNHAQEIDNSVVRAVARLRANGELVYNQTVLLKGVNDSVAALKSLSETLITIGVQPYYLHLLDQVRGTHHFNVESKTALSLIQELSRSVPGYMLPQLVREQAGKPAKSRFCLDSGCKKTST
ncbi:MAG: EF-P beta-lysylation protein EpmB [Gammaproteobacteria bacterium]|nr:EF-P beta-lysylation protein EpmB [Gammaproteobacteria bacterium]